MDETWFESHDTGRKLWSDSSSQCAVSDQPSRSKRAVICRDGSNEGFVNRTLFYCGKKLLESFADYYGDMNGQVFEDLSK